MSDSPSAGTPILNLQDAEITERLASDTASSKGEAPPILLPNQEHDLMSHIALDIGGSLIKLVYFSPNSEDEGAEQAGATSSGHNGIKTQQVHKGGRLHFVKFETSHIDDCINFIAAKGLHCVQTNGTPTERKGARMRIKATGGGAYRFAEVFSEKLGLEVDKVDEMSCLVSGCNFLLTTISHEAFTYSDGTPEFQNIQRDTDVYPYLLVNIGSGVSMLKVEGPETSTRVSGSNLGGGTFWGLCRLLTGVRNFDEMLEMSMRGNNAAVDMLVGDIYGGDYASIGLSADTIASSFGKVVGAGLDLADVNPADIALALCRMVSYNTSHLAYLVARDHGLSRVFFGGFFIRGHPYTMDTISYAINFWSKGSMAAKFLRHEGFLGAVGAFLKVSPGILQQAAAATASSRRLVASKRRPQFVEKFSMGAPFTGGEVHGPVIQGVQEKVSWVEKFVAVGAVAAEAARSELSAARVPSTGLARSQSDAASALTSQAALARGRGGGGSDPHLAAVQASAQDRAASEGGDGAPPPTPSCSMTMALGVLHFTPFLEMFPLLADPVGYEPNTVDIMQDKAEKEYWVSVLDSHVDTVMLKAIASERGGEGGPPTPEVQRRAAAFGRAFRAHLQRIKTHPEAYGRLGLADLFDMREECLREFGFDDVYLPDKERENVAALEVFPDLLQELDALSAEDRLLALVEGALAANIFDWGSKACVDLYSDAKILDIYKEARLKLCKRPWRVDGFDALKAAWFARSDLPQPSPGVARSPYRRVMMFIDNAGADVVLGMLPFARELLRMGSDVVLVANHLPAINDMTATELRRLILAAGGVCPTLQRAYTAGLRARDAQGGLIPPYPGCRMRASSSAADLASLTRAASSSGESGVHVPNLEPAPRKRSLDAQQGATMRVPLLFVESNGQGGPCLDLRRVDYKLLDACAGTDLVLIEGMGRALHTNLKARFTCDSFKLAMIKTERLAQKLFAGKLYDCVCQYEPAMLRQASECGARAV